MISSLAFIVTVCHFLLDEIRERSMLHLPSLTYTRSNVYLHLYLHLYLHIHIFSPSTECSNTRGLASMLYLREQRSLLQEAKAKWSVVRNNSRRPFCPLTPRVRRSHYDDEKPSIVWCEGCYRSIRYVEAFSVKFVRCSVARLAQTESRILALKVMGQNQRKLRSKTISIYMDR